MRAAHASVLRETDPAVGKEVTGFNLTDRGLNELAELSALVFIDRRLQVLNFGCAFSDKDDEGNVGNSSHPGITDQLWVESQKAVGLLGVSGCGRFPVDDAFRTVNFTDRIDVGDEIATIRKRSSQFHLE